MCFEFHADAHILIVNNDSDEDNIKQDKSIDVYGRFDEEDEARSRSECARWMQKWHRGRAPAHSSFIKKYAEMKSEGTVRSHIHMVVQISKIVVYVTTYSGIVVKCVCSILAY